ncbi:hypothetical protein [Pseudonocardia sp. WMMC193]|uniref:hypothetical protein n=1 Tax=Pseudonocardia sp. WMMC193 TaxID=2911965 RepID=UPI001F380673|nr:hypothetical protein [Pseudonocardia sp. WMMC193]MCF7547230.1 hypothetical protein [Pseudonocardia sp. WMMC193]
MGDAMTWWVQTASVDPDNSTVRNLQQYLTPVIIAMLTGSIFVQAIRMMLSRRKDPAINVGLGLFRYAVVSLLGLAVMSAAIKAGDEFSQWLVESSMGGFAERIGGALTPGAVQNSFLLLITAGLLAFLALIQWVLGFIRQAGLMVLAVLLPVAASGSINDSTKVWLNRMLPWAISLVLYKPMAAVIYAIGFQLLGNGQDFTTIMTGIMVIVLAIVAMPAMMRFFSWTQVSASGGGGVGSALAAGASGAASMAALRSARGMEMTGPGSAPSGAGQPGGSSRALTAGPGSADSASGSGSAGGGGGGGSSAGAGAAGSGAAGASPGGATASAAGATGGGAAGGGAAASGGGGGGAGGGAAASGGGGVAAAAGPAGAAAAAGAAVARGAQQAGQTAADGFTQGGEQR